MPASADRRSNLVLAAVTDRHVLLTWLRARLQGYRAVRVDDLTKSWKDGLAFCALVHSFAPDAIDFDSLSPTNAAANLKLAFATAESRLDIPELLETEFFTDVETPDEKTTRLYLSEFYNKFHLKGAHHTPFSGGINTTLERPRPRSGDSAHSRASSTSGTGIGGGNGPGGSKRGQSAGARSVEESKSGNGRLVSETVDEQPPSRTRVAKAVAAFSEGTTAPPVDTRQKVETSAAKPHRTTGVPGPPATASTKKREVAVRGGPATSKKAIAQPKPLATKGSARTPAVMKQAEPKVVRASAPIKARLGSPPVSNAQNRTKTPSRAAAPVRSKSVGRPEQKVTGRPASDRAPTGQAASAAVSPAQRAPPRVSAPKPAKQSAPPAAKASGTRPTPARSSRPRG